jgi:hypothetical protein
LRGAIGRGDGAGAVHLLTGRPWPEDTLQLIGDGLLIALRQQVDCAGELAGHCAALLRTRGWDGDEELADSLQAQVGTAPTGLPKPLLVDLEELALVLEGDPVHGGGRIDLNTGEVWPQAASTTPWKRERWARTMTTLIVGSGSTAKAPGPGFATCSGSSHTSKTRTPRTVSALRSVGVERSGGSRTLCLHGPTCRTGGSPSLGTGDAAAREPGSPTRATPRARRPPTTSAPRHVEGDEELATEMRRPSAGGAR